MSDYPIGVYRSASFGGTITNCQGNSLTPGGAAVRIYSVFLKGAAVSNSNLQFFNGLSSASTANVYLTVALDSTNPTSTTFDSHAGMLFPNGCVVTTSAAIDYGTIVFRPELY